MGLPSGSVDAAQLMEIDEGAVNVSPPAGERPVGVVGAAFWIVALSDVPLAVNKFHVCACVVSMQLILSDLPKFAGARVAPVWPEISDPFLYHARVIADAFSRSESMSANAPLLQVSDVVLLGGRGVIVGCPRVGALSGYELDADAVVVNAPVVSLKLIASVEVAGWADTQLNVALNELPAVELER